MPEYEIRDEYPPIYEKAKEVFPLKGGEIFAWGPDIIYAPGHTHIPPWLIDHELVHFKQQQGEPEYWWRLYLSDPAWRYIQELEAHQEEYRSFCRHNKDGNKRFQYLVRISRRLASPMYGSLVSASEAMKSIASRR